MIEETDAQNPIKIGGNDKIVTNVITQHTVIGINRITFLDAQNLEFYKRKLKEPIMRVWILSDVDEKKIKYTNKRLFEEARRMNIQLDIMYIPKFDLVCQKDGMNTILYDGEPVTEMPDCVVCT